MLHTKKISYPLLCSLYDFEDLVFKKILSKINDKN